jgi:predicted permease
MSIEVTATQVAIMFLLMAMGWVAYRVKLFNDSAITGMTNLLLYIVMPCIILDAFYRPFDPDQLREVGAVFALDMLSFPIAIGLAYLVFAKRLVADPIRRVQLRFGAVYSNAGFMGIPLASALIGKDGVLTGVVFVIAFSIVAWTHGISTFDTQGSVTPVQRLVKIVTNPAIIATVVAVGIFCFSIPLPTIVSTAVSHVSAINTPLSMVVIGGTLAQLPLRSLSADAIAWLGAAMRNLILPLVFAGILYFVPVSPTIKLAVLIPLACPVAAYLVMFGVIKNQETGFSTKLMCMSTLASVVTVPVVLAFGPWLWSLAG